METLLGSHPPHRTRWISWAWLATLYLAGFVLWGYFFSWGRFPLNFHDWAHITGPRLAFLKDALVQGQLPLHISDPDPSDPYPLGGITDRFLAIPDQILSPQVILLPVLPIGVFVAGNVLLLYSLGYAGLLWLRRKFSLSLVAFTILFLLFNFNGHILAHLAVGHATWGGYFLFPWFAILVFKLVEGERGWAWIAKMALLLLAIFLQGSFHQFVWALIFLALLAVAKRGYFLTAAGGAVFGVLLSLVRILPPASMLGKFDDQFKTGYPTLVDLWQSLVTVYVPGSDTPAVLMNRPLGYWELSLYVGLAGAIFLLYFGVWRWLSDCDDHNGFQSLVLPVLGLVVLSIGQIYRIIHLMPIPLLGGERVSSRFISLPFVFIIFFAVIYFQDWLNQPHRSKTLVYLIISAGFIISLSDLWQNYRIWRVVAVAPNFKEQKFFPQAWILANHSDPDYLGLILAGAALSLVSLGVLIFFAWRSRRQAV